MLLKVWYSIRGGSWFSRPAFARASLRDGNEPSERGEDLGVRCARKVK